MLPLPKGMAYVYIDDMFKPPCAPGGECLEQNVYATLITNWKSLQIQADPVFTRNTMAELTALQHGGYAAVSGIASDEGAVSFQVFSVGSKAP